MSINQKFLLYLSRFAEAYPIGHSKYAPGTIGSLIGVLFGSFLILNLDVKFYLIFLLIFIIVSYLFCEAHLKFYNKKDPKEVVVDEISGQFIAILGCVQSDKSTYMFLSFLLSALSILFCSSLDKGLRTTPDLFSLIFSFLVLTGSFAIPLKFLVLFFIPKKFYRFLR